MKRLLIALLLAAAPSQAATYWVSPTGSSGASGSDSLSNAKSLAWFNANAQPGDVCRFKSGTYSTPIYPSVDGTAANRIRYYGFPQDPGAVVVADIHFGYARGDYCTAKWFTVNGHITGVNGINGTAYFDSLVNIRTRSQGGEFQIEGVGGVFDSLSITGGVVSGGGQDHWINMYYSGVDIYAKNNMVKNSTFGVTINSSGDVHVIGMGKTHSNTFLNNTFNITVASCSGYFFDIEMYRSYYNTFQNNTFNTTINSCPGGTKGLISHRDSSSYNRYVGNTFITTGGTNCMGFLLSNSGSFPGTTGHNYYGYNTWKTDSPQTALIHWQDGSRADTLEFNVFAGNNSSPTMWTEGGVNGMVFRHNTCWTQGRTVIDFGSGSFGNSPRFAQNIFYSASSNSDGNEILRLPSGSVDIDSAGVFFARGGSNAYAVDQGGTNRTAGGTNLTHSVWGSPGFADSSYATLDPRVASPGPAVGSNWTDGFAGARPFVGGDVTAPATVSNLSVTQSDSTSLVLGWTAPGDDGMSGTANLYDMRWSTSPINPTNFSAATTVSPQPVPVAGGQAQSYVKLGLSPGATYYFALRARDEAGNWSGVSNTATGTTTNTADTTPPAAINDLGASP